MPLTDTTRDELGALAARYPVARAALLPMLHLVQSHEGYVSEDGIALCAEVLHLTKAEVGAVATFYTMYKREPVGDYLLSVCTNPTCKIVGGQDIFDGWVEACGGALTDPEAGVMVEHAECLGICDAAPVVQINYEMYHPASVDEGLDLLAKAKAGSPPASNRSGETPATFREVERELSGIDDGVHDHLVEAARRQATSDVPPAYRSGETDLPVTHPGGDPAGHGGAAFTAAAGFAGDASDAARTDAATAATADRPSVEDLASPASKERAAELPDELGREGRVLADHVAHGSYTEAPKDASIGAGATTDEESASPVGDDASSGGSGVPADGESGASPGGDDGDAGDPVDRTGGADDDAATDPIDREPARGSDPPSPPADDPVPTAGTEGDRDGTDDDATTDGDAADGSAADGDDDEGTA